MNVAPLTSELVAAPEQFTTIADECRQFARRIDPFLQELLDTSVDDKKWSIIDDMLCDLHDACDAIADPRGKRATTESLEFTARPERHVVATYLGSVPEYFRTMRPIHPRLADAVANAESVFGCRVWVEPGAILCDDAAACDAVRQFVDEYLAG